jgi:hypothetical protein
VTELQNNDKKEAQKELSKQAGFQEHQNTNLETDSNTGL